MGDNKEERKKMKKTRYVALVLLSSLLTLVGCSRREILDDYPVTGINIRLDWEGVTGRLPEGIRVIFYPKDAQGSCTPRLRLRIWLSIEEPPYTGNTFSPSIYLE